MKKLLLVGSNSIHVYNYIKLIENYFDEILLLSNEKNEQYSVKSIKIDFRLGLNIPSSISKIKAVLKEYNPSVIHIHQANSYAFITLLALKNSNIPSLLTAWGSDILVNPKESFLLKKIVSYTLNHVTRATSDSLFMANEMKHYNTSLKIDIVNFGIKPILVDIKKENIIYSNRLHNSLYNIGKVIQSFSNFSFTNPSWQLVIGAVGRETEELKSMVRDLKIEDKVEFIGWVDGQVNEQIYQRSKIFISIPSSDATAISLLEAISYNCICFVSNLPANCEHILDGINGFIEPNLDKIDLEKYSQIDMKLLEDVNRVRSEKYLKEYNQKKFIEVYNELLKGKL
jgi:glycosyltransferase involved in cell wall biosynthesis